VARAGAAKRSRREAESQMRCFSYCLARFRALVFRIRSAIGPALP